jgi:hypothetical protein
MGAASPGVMAASHAQTIEIHLIKCMLILSSLRTWGR